jgi:hypothetical protein
MMLSGSSSYYDEYIRKKSTGRAINDPPSLLTDRGAYVNFLEVQLERVSAACLGVQAYDQRFNDVQQLIVTLEQRCGSTTRLVGLAQQCTEELRGETDRKLQQMQADMKEEYKNMQVMHQATNTRIAATEQSIATLMDVVERVGHMEIAMKRQEDEFNAKLVRCNEENRQLHVQLDQLQSFHHQQNIEINSLKTNVSKLDFVVEENDKRVYNAITASEKRMADAASRDADEMNRKFHVLNSKLANDLDTMQKEHHSREVNLHASIRKVKESLLSDLVNMRHDIEETHDKLIIRCSERMNDEIKTFKLSINGRIQALELILEQTEETVKTLTTSAEQSTNTDQSRYQALDEAQKLIQQAQVQMRQQLNGIEDRVARLSGGRGSYDSGNGVGGVATNWSYPSPQPQQQSYGYGYGNYDETSVPQNSQGRASYPPASFYSGDSYVPSYNRPQQNVQVPPPYYDSNDFATAGADSGDYAQQQSSQPNQVPWVTRSLPTAPSRWLTQQQQQMPPDPRQYVVPLDSDNRYRYQPQQAQQQQQQAPQQQQQQPLQQQYRQGLTALAPAPTMGYNDVESSSSSSSSALPSELRSNAPNRAATVLHRYGDQNEADTGSLAGNSSSGDYYRGQPRKQQPGPADATSKPSKSASSSSGAKDADDDEQVNSRQQQRAEAKSGSSSVGSSNENMKGLFEEFLDLYREDQQEIKRQ